MKNSNKFLEVFRGKNDKPHITFAFGRWQVLDATIYLIPSVKRNAQAHGFVNRLNKIDQLAEIKELKKQLTEGKH
jgi:hypothetical protein